MQRIHTAHSRPLSFRSHMHTHTHIHAYTHTHTPGTECWQSSRRDAAHHHHDSARHGAPRNSERFQISESSNADRAPLAAPHLSRTGFQKKTCCKRTHTHIRPHIHVRTHTHTYEYTHKHTQTYTHTHIHTLKYTHMRTHTQT